MADATRVAVADQGAGESLEVDNDRARHDQARHDQARHDRERHERERQDHAGQHHARREARLQAAQRRAMPAGQDAQPAAGLPLAPAPGARTGIAIRVAFVLKAGAQAAAMRPEPACVIRQSPVQVSEGRASDGLVSEGRAMAISSISNSVDHDPTSGGLSVASACAIAARRAGVLRCVFAQTAKQNRIRLRPGRSLQASRPQPDAFPAQADPAAAEVAGQQAGAVAAQMAAMMGNRVVRRAEPRAQIGAAKLATKVRQTAQQLRAQQLRAQQQRAQQQRGQQVQSPATRAA